MPRIPDNHCSATTGIPTNIGDYRGPTKNSPPNPGGYWFGCVMTIHGMKHVQEVGEQKTWAAMLRLGAKD